MSKSVLVQGLNQETARALLDAAKRLGLGPEVVETSSQGGFIVPEEVYNALGDAPGEDFTESGEIRTYALEAGEDPTEGPDQKFSSVGEGKKVEEEPNLGPARAEAPAQSARVETEDEGDQEPKRRGGSGGRRPRAEQEETK